MQFEGTLGDSSSECFSKWIIVKKSNDHSSHYQYCSCMKQPSANNLHGDSCFWLLNYYYLSLCTYYRTMRKLSSLFFLVNKKCLCLLVKFAVKTEEMLLLWQSVHCGILFVFHFFVFLLGFVCLFLWGFLFAWFLWKFEGN